MSHNEPASSAQPIVGDHHAWPSTHRGSQPFTPYGVSLQPGELLTQTWRVWRSDAWRFVGVTALPYGVAIVAAVVLFAAMAVVVGDITNLDNLAMSGPLLGLIVGGGGGLLITASLLIIAATAGTYHAAEECLRQEKRTDGVLGTLLVGLSSLVRLVGLYLVSSVTVVLLVMPAVFMITWAVSGESWALGGVGVLLGFGALVASVVLGMRFFLLAGPVIVAEDVGIVAALRRSAELSRGRVVDLFLACLVMGAVAFGINMVSSALVLLPVVGVLGQLAVTVALASLQGVFLFLLYAGARDLEG
jgi:hypothetical protein